MIIRIFEIAGSLGLFLFGMKIMGEGIQKSAGASFQNILNIMTINRFAAVMTGFLITSLIQSSSATTVMVVSFVNAGLLSLVQAIGVIMGANIGTTVTGWLVSIIGFKFNISAIALPAVGLGIPILFLKKFRQKSLGEFLIGFGILFLGLNLLKNSVPDIRDNPESLKFLSRFTNLGFSSYLLFVATGTIVTIIVQSSSAAMAITITMAFSGWIDFPTSAAIILGENIGTTITAFLASLNANVHARRAARAHTLFNLIGVFWMSFLFYPFLQLVDFLVPGDSTTPQNIPVHLAMFHTSFNVANTIVFIGFIKYFARLVEFIVKERKGESLSGYKFPYISSTALHSPSEFNILKAKYELAKMASIVHEMFAIFIKIFNNPKKKMGEEVDHLKNMEDYTDAMQEEISKYLVECSKENLNEVSIENVNAMIRITDELESIGDSCFALIIILQKRYDKKISFHEEALQDIQPYIEIVEDFLVFTQKHLNKHMTDELYDIAFHIEEQVNKYRNVLKKAAQKRLKSGSNVKSELLYLDVLKHIEHIGDFSLEIAKALRQIK
ncbi:MAG: Na/Pi cotransporter family protein [Spirochaetota bacterium]